MTTPKKEKACSKCKIVKNCKTEFHRSNNMIDGRHTICKDCRCAYNLPKALEWNRKNRKKKKQPKESIEQRG